MADRFVYLECLDVLLASSLAVVQWPAQSEPEAQLVSIIEQGTSIAAIA